MSRRPRRRIAAACITATAALGCVAVPAGAFRATDRITKDGLGAIKIGMTVSQIEDRLGASIDVQYPNDESCGSAELGRKVFGLFSHGRLTRIDVLTTRYRTRKGVHVGNSTALVHARYGNQVKASPHAYVRGGQYLKVTTRNRRVVFATDATGRITQVSTGRIPDVDYIEGCA